MSENNKPQRLCEVAGCGRTHYARGLCRRHYLQMTRSQGKKSPADIISNPRDRFNIERPECSEPGCNRTRVTALYCALHQTRANAEVAPKREKPNCKITGCTNQSRTRGMCNKHYQAWFRENSDENGRLLPSVKVSK